MFYGSFSTRNGSKSIATQKSDITYIVLVQLMGKGHTYIFASTIELGNKELFCDPKIVP